MIKIVVDSTADYSIDYASEHLIKVVPLSVSFENETFKEGIDISVKDFYAKLKTCKDLPKTSQPSPADFEEVYLQAKENGDEVIVFTITSSLSGTYQSALIAKDLAGYDKIEVIDSVSASLGVQLLVLEAEKMIKEGLSFEEVVSKSKENVSKLKLFAIIDTLKYLVKGGRISKATGAVGSIIAVKPIFTLDESGNIEILKSTRGIKKGLSELSEIIKSNKVNTSKPILYGYTDIDDNLKVFKESVGFKSSGTDVGIGAVIGTHVGPNAAVIAFFEE